MSADRFWQPTNRLWISPRGTVHFAPPSEHGYTVCGLDCGPRAFVESRNQEPVFRCRRCYPKAAAR